MLVLFETPAGYAVFKLLDEKKLQATDNLYKDFETPERAAKVVKLKHFEKFKDTTEALAATTAAVEGKMSKSLKKLLKKQIVGDMQEQLLVADAKLGGCIKEKLALTCVSSSAVQELMRCIRSQIDGLLAGLPQKELTAMALGLAHSLSRYKLKFSPDKVDTMIVQAISLLDDLDKELNNYIMRCREWYGWHFPELGKIVTDNTAFVKIVKFVGTREKMIDNDLSEIIPEELEQQVKEAAEISMGTEISEEDIENIQILCDQVLEITLYRSQLYDYLRARMMAIAPNLTVLVGELIGARLISHAGSLLNLAKHPASTVQILGAEKALFRALKTHRDTPKYGLIYHAQLVGQASTKNKGKVSRMLAAKAALATRVDALGEEMSAELGTEHRAALVLRLKELEEGAQRRVSGTGKVKQQNEKHSFKSEVKLYKNEMDSTIPSGKLKRPFIEQVDDAESPGPKKKKMKYENDDEGETSFGQVKIKKESSEDIEEESGSLKKKKKKKSLTAATQEEDDVAPKKKKKKSLVEAPEEVEEEAAPKKKKKKSLVEAPEETAPKKKKKSLVEEEEEEEAPQAETPKKKKKHALLEEQGTSDKKKKKQSLQAAEDAAPQPESGKKKKKKKSLSQE